jgi:hypothetical protein
MTYGQILKQRTSTADQCGPHAYQRVRHYSASRQCHGSSIWYLQAPSISICSRSSKKWYSYPDTRIKSCVHHQNSSQSNSDAATIFRTIGTDLGRDCYTGPGNIFAQRPSAWQKAGKNQNRSSLNIVLIAYRPKSSLWSMSF